MKQTKKPVATKIFAKDLPNVYESLFPQYKKMGKKEQQRMRKILDAMIIEPNETEPQLFN